LEFVMKKSLIVAAILSLFAAASFAQAPVTHKPAHHHHHHAHHMHKHVAK